MIPYEKRKEYFKNYYMKNKPNNMLERVLEVETSNEKYFKYWQRFIGYDIREKLTQKVMTKGEFYRKYTALAEKMSDPANTLDKRFEVVEKAIVR